MDNKNSTLVSIIIILIFALIGLVYYKLENKTNRKLENESQENWEKWPNSKPNPTPTQPDVKPEPEKPNVKNLKANSISEALELAKKNDKKIFLFFGTKSCSWCEKLKNTTFEDEKVSEKMSELIYFYCDASENKQLSRKYKVVGVPAYFILDKNEEIIKSGKGFKNSNEFIKWLETGYSLEENYTILE
jgi:thioredoxin-related protein